MSATKFALDLTVSPNQPYDETAFWGFCREYKDVSLPGERDSEVAGI